MSLSIEFRNYRVSAHDIKTALTLKPMQCISFKVKIEDLYYKNEITDHEMGGGGPGDIAFKPVFT